MSILQLRRPRKKKEFYIVRKSTEVRQSDSWRAEQPMPVSRWLEENVTVPMYVTTHVKFGVIDSIPVSWSRHYWLFPSGIVHPSEDIVRDRFPLRSR